MPNAIEMLRADHRKVKDLFEQFEQSDESGKKEIVIKTIKELETHTTLEEEIFYPAAQEQIDEEDLIDEAQEEHHVVKLVVAELKKKMSANDKRYDAKYKVMAESVKHHIQEEESELFPRLEGKLDSEELGEQMEARKQELQKPPKRAVGKRTGSRKRRGARKGQRASKRARGKASGGRR
jgi:hemerythrin-like domain-containing protein